MSDHDHDHDHAPIADGDEPPAAARVRALEALLVEKGVISHEDGVYTGRTGKISTWPVPSSHPRPSTSCNCSAA